MSYEIYHDTFSQSITEMLEYVTKNGYSIVEEDLSRDVTFGSGRPRVGETKSFHLGLIKNDKPQKKHIHFQVYGMERKYELNMYIS
jgi:hypothetical protein